MIPISIALVLVAALAVYALSLFLAVRYPPAPTEDSGPLAKEIAGLKGRIETLELQRGIQRHVKGTGP